MVDILEQKQELSPRYAELIADIFIEVLGRILSPEVIKEVCGEDITLSQLHALRYIHRHEQECSVTELAEGLSVTTPAATKLIDRLEKHEWVIRREDEKDHRVFHVRLTDRGRLVTEKVKALRSRRMEQIIKTMSPASRQALLDGLESFIYTAMADKKMLETVCQHCGIDALDSCIINRSHVEQERIHEHVDNVCN
jgi:MarR family transcriptional regulator, organic hydroperoxide resistance regulator